MAWRRHTLLRGISGVRVKILDNTPALAPNQPYFYSDPKYTFLLDIVILNEI